MNEATVSYVDAIRFFGESDKSLRTLGLYLLNQFDCPVNWFDSAADYAFGMAFREFVFLFRQVAPGKRPNVVRLTWDGCKATVALPSGKLAVSA